MKFNKAELAYALTTLKPLVSNNKEYKGVLYDKGTLRAKDENTEIMLKLSEETDNTFVIPEIGIALIASFPDDEVEIEAKAESEVRNIKIKAGKVKTTLATLKAEDYQPLNAAKQGTTVDFKTDELKKILASVLFCCDTSTNDNSKTQYKGVHFYAADGIIHSVACDGYRMAEATITAESERFDTIIPNKTAQRVIATELGDEVRILSAKSSITFKGKNATIVSCVYDGAFLDPNKAFPPAQSELEISRTEFMSYCKKVQLITPSKEKNIYPSELNFETNGSIQAKYVSPTATVEESFEFEGSLPKPIRMGTNTEYIYSVFSALEDDKIKIGVSESKAPITFKSTDESFRAMVLPVRLKDKTTTQG